MVEEKAFAGKNALGAWFHRCRTELGGIGVGVFRKLMASLVESTMLYGSEIWGCNWKLEKIEQVQMKALRLFCDIRTLHPYILLKRLARLRGVIFWGKVLTSRTYFGQLLRLIAAEAVRFGRGTWICMISTFWWQFG